jgi:hypothetical protein
MSYDPTQRANPNEQPLYPPTQAASPNQGTPPTYYNQQGPDVPPPPPYAAQPSYQAQPAYPAIPAYPPQGVPQSGVPKKRSRWLWIVLGIVAVLVLACGLGTYFIANAVQHNPATDAVNGYFTDFKNQNYSHAYSYFSSGMQVTAGGQTTDLTQDVFTQLAQGYDSQKGKLTDYSITSTNLQSNNGTNTGDYTIHVTRSGGAYDVHLSLQQQGDEWKIVKFDSL